MKNKTRVVSFILALVCALAVFAGLFWAGLTLTRQLPAATVPMQWVLLPSAAGLILVPAVFLFLFFRKRNRLNAARVRDINEQMEERKKQAREASDRGQMEDSAAELRRELRLTLLYNIVLTLLCCLVLFCVPAAPYITPTLLILPAGAVLYSLLYRCFTVLLFRADAGKTASKEEYPVLFALIHRAMDACGVRQKLRVYWTSDGTASITTVGLRKNTGVAVMIAGSMLDWLNEEELYTVLLHEFSHISGEAVQTPASGFTYAFTACQPAGDSYDFLGAWLWRYQMLSVEYSYFVYTMSASEFVERLTDAAALRLGNREAFASALVKICMLSRAELITDDYLDPEEGGYLREELPQRFYLAGLEALRAAYEENHSRWFDSFFREKQPKNATHPILRDRLANLGLSLGGIRYALPDPGEDTPFRRECRRVCEAVNREISDAISEIYPERRRRLYLPAVETVQKYEENGCRCEIDEAHAVIDALDMVYRYADAEALCRRLIADPALTDEARAYPLFWLGRFLLNHDNGEGLDLIYRAAEANSNGVEATVDIVGSYCCRNGLEEEYLEYRRRAETLLEHLKNVDSKRGELLPSDNLSEEHFPEEKMKTLLDFIRKAGGDELKAVYLVHKTISDDPDGYASQFVLEFRENADEERCGKAYDAVFNYLDSDPTGWNYSLFVYDKQVERAIRKVRNCCVYRNEAPAAVSLSSEDEQDGPATKESVNHEIQ